MDMTLVEFEHIIEAMSFYFQKSKPKKEAGLLWFEQVKKISELKK